MLTLKKWMSADICCIHFHIYRSSHPEVFFKKGVLHLASLQENIHAEVWVQPTEITLLNGYSSKSMKHICSRKPFLKNTSWELILYTFFNIERLETENFVDKTQKRTEKYIRLWYLNCNLCAGHHSFKEIKKICSSIKKNVKYCEPYFWCPSFLCTHIGPYYTRVVLYYTHVFSCYVVLYSCSVVLFRVVLVLSCVGSCCTRVVSCWLMLSLM